MNGIFKEANKYFDSQIREISKLLEAGVDAEQSEARKAVALLRTEVALKVEMLYSNMRSMLLGEN